MQLSVGFGCAVFGVLFPFVKKKDPHKTLRLLLAVFSSPFFVEVSVEKKQLKSLLLHFSSSKSARAREESTRHTKRDPFVVARYPHRWSSKNALAAKLIMCLGNSGPVQAMGAMANGKTNRRQTTMTTRRKRVNFDGGGEDEDASSNDEEEEEEKERDGITLEGLQACVLDSECAAAKKFGCGTTRFKTMYALSNLLIVLLAFLSTFFFHIGCEMVKRHGTSSRDSRSLSLLPTHLSLSLSVFRCRKLGIARWPHRKLHSLLEMYKSLAGYYKVGKEIYIVHRFLVV